MVNKTLHSGQKIQWTKVESIFISAIIIRVSNKIIYIIGIDTLDAYYHNPWKIIQFIYQKITKYNLCFLMLICVHFYSLD